MTIRQRQEISTVTPEPEATRLRLTQPDAVLHEPVLARVSKSTFIFHAFLCAMLCVSLSARGEPTVGQQFRDIMAEIDAKCRKEKLGPYLDPNEPPRSAKRTNGSCDTASSHVSVPAKRGSWLKLSAGHWVVSEKFSKKKGHGIRRV